MKYHSADFAYEEALIIGAGSSQRMWGQDGSAIHVDSYIFICDIKKTFHSHALYLIYTKPTFMWAHFHVGPLCSVTHTVKLCK